MAGSGKHDSSSEEAARSEKDIIATPIGEDAQLTGNAVFSEEDGEPVPFAATNVEPEDMGSSASAGAAAVPEGVSEKGGDSPVAAQPFDATGPDETIGKAVIDDESPGGPDEEGGQAEPTGETPEPLVNEPESADSGYGGEAGTPVSDEAKAPFGQAGPAQSETVVVKRRGSVWPGFLGGAVAAIGLFFASPYVVPPKYLPRHPEVDRALDGQSDAVATLQAEVATQAARLAETVSEGDLAALESASKATMSELSSVLDTLATRSASAAAFDKQAGTLAEVVARLEALEKRPIDGAVDPAAVAAVEAYGREIAELRERLESQMTEADSLVQAAIDGAEASVREALDAAAAQTAEAEAAAQAAADEAQRVLRAQALVDIRAALEDGNEFDAALSALAGVEMPHALSSVAPDGVATLSELRDAFVKSARAALAVSRAEASGDSVTARTTTWLQNQLGMRSLAPSEGGDPDSVLSRAEAALAAARIPDAIAEISALPDTGKAAMADWIAIATERVEAIAAADELAASLAAK